MEDFSGDNPGVIARKVGSYPNHEPSLGRNEEGFSVPLI
jgi:hypothetical protein